MPDINDVWNWNFVHYPSLEINFELALSEFERMIKLGFAVEFIEEQVRSEFPEAHVAKLGFIVVKEKADGSTKARLIVNMLRSKANSKAVIPER